MNICGHCEERRRLAIEWVRTAIREVQRVRDLRVEELTYAAEFSLTYRRRSSRSLSPWRSTRCSPKSVRSEVGGASMRRRQLAAHIAGTIAAATGGPAGARYVEGRGDCLASSVLRILQLGDPEAQLVGAWVAVSRGQTLVVAAATYRAALQARRLRKLGVRVVLELLREVLAQVQALEEAAQLDADVLAKVHRRLWPAWRP